MNVRYFDWFDSVEQSIETISNVNIELEKMMKNSGFYQR